MRRHASLCRYPLLLIVMPLAYAVQASHAVGDLNTYQIRTIGWLVDNSDTIAVLRTRDRAEGTAPEILTTLKGSPRNVIWPLPKRSLVDKKGYQNYVAPSRGLLSLVFLRNRTELLEQIGIAREPAISEPTIPDVYFGVTEFGRLLSSETELFEAVTDRIRTGPGQPIGFKAQSRNRQPNAVGAPREFALEASSESYYLIVPFTTRRRDHFVRVLRTGNASARVYAIGQLSLFVDDTAVAAIRKATTVKDVIPAYRYTWKTEPLQVITSKDVREAAANALARD